MLIRCYNLTVSDNVEFIVTLRCKVCGDIISLAIPLDFEKATEGIQKFTEDHEHNKGPWIV